MTGLEEHGALVERFAVAKPDYALHADQQTAISAKQHENDLAGQKSGSVEGVQLSSAAASKNAQDSRDGKAENAAKQRAADMLLQALLDQIADLDRKIDTIDEQIRILEAKIDTLNDTIAKLQDGSLTPDEALNDPAIGDAIAVWEQRTGKKFDPNDPEAADILVDILTSQVDRFGNDLAGLKHDRGELGAQRDKLQAGVNEIVQMQAEGASPEAVTAKAEEVAAKYEGGDLVGTDQRLEFSVAEEVGRDNQDSHSDVVVNTSDMASDNMDAMAGLLGGNFGGDTQLSPADTEPPSEKLAAAVQDARLEFQTAAALPTSATDNEMSLQGPQVPVVGA